MSIGYMQINTTLFYIRDLLEHPQILVSMGCSGANPLCILKDNCIKYSLYGSVLWQMPFCWVPLSLCTFPIPGLTHDIEYLRFSSSELLITLQVPDVSFITGYPMHGT